MFGHSGGVRGGILLADGAKDRALRNEFHPPAPSSVSETRFSVGCALALRIKLRAMGWPVSGIPT